MKGYKLYDQHTKEIFISRDVMFYEDIFPFAQKDVQETHIDPFLEDSTPSVHVDHHDDSGCALDEGE